MYNIKHLNICEYYVGGHLNGLLICIFTVAVVFLKNILHFMHGIKKLDPDPYSELRRDSNP